MADEVTYFDPVTGTYKTGVPPANYGKDPSAVPGGSSAHYDNGSRDPRQWGGYGRSLDPEGKPVAGTSGGERDVARYRGMGDAHDAAPVIDQTRSNESRGIQDRALGALRRASTGADSYARTLGEQQAVAAGRSAQSLAASVRGGPMARAAAARGVNQNAGALQARAKLATDAAVANEMAGARGAYAGALAGQRGQDLGLANSQAGLNLGQRTADDQREGFYEGLGWDTANTQLESGLGISRGDQQAGAASRAAMQADADRRAQGTQDMITTVVGGATGLAQGSNAAAGQGKPAPPQGNGPGVRYGYFDDGSLSDDKTKFAKAWDGGNTTARMPDTSREAPYVLSDKSAKREAFMEGMQYGAGNSKEFPSYMPNRVVREAKSDTRAVIQKPATYAKDPSAPGTPPDAIDAQMEANRKRIQGDFDPTAQDARMAAPPIVAPPSAATPPSPPEPAPQAQPGYVSQLLSRARAMTSDERAKESKGYVPGVMADANRSMKPSVYEYKPEYAGRAGQDVGEKNVGPMANPMAKDPVASVAVEKQPDGMLAIDKDKGLKLVMGGLADLQMQVDAMKRRKGAAA